MRWLGFDLVVLFNDSFFMACMFLISGLFVHASLTRRGAAGYVRHRAWRLGIPFLVSIFVLMPIAYYPTFLRYHLPGTTDFNFFHFWWHTLTIGPWPSGPAWFLWVLLAFDIVAAALVRWRRGMVKTFGLLIFTLRDRPLDRPLPPSWRSRSRSICRCIWCSAIPAGWSRAAIRCRSRPAAFCSMPAIS